MGSLEVLERDGSSHPETFTFPPIIMEVDKRVLAKRTEKSPKGSIFIHFPFP